jgi:hypothetical protein
MKTIKVEKKMFMEQKGYILFVKTQKDLQCSQIQKHLIVLLLQ